MVGRANTWYSLNGMSHARYPPTSKFSMPKAKKDGLRQKESSEQGDKQAICSKVHQASDFPIVVVEHCCDT